MPTIIFHSKNWGYAPELPQKGEGRELEMKKEEEREEEGGEGKGLSQ